MLDTKQTLTVSAAEQNFFRAKQIADENGAAILFEDGHPKYKLTNLEVEPDLELTDDEKIDVVAHRVMKRFKPAFLELAK